VSNQPGGTGKVRVGDKAPDFTLPSQDGTPVRLYDLLGTRAVVLFFYPKDHSKNCTIEACAFRDSYEVFTQAGAEVIGISMDSAESHAAFAAHNRLPFLLLSDTAGAVRRLYGVPPTLGIMPGRVTYILDTQGMVRKLVAPLLQPAQHVTESLAIVQQIAAAGSRS